MKKEYLGDGVYAQLIEARAGGHDLMLTTEDGYSITNTIILEPEVLQALLDYVVQRGPQ